MSSEKYYIVDASKWQVLSVLDENGVLIPFPYQSYEEARASMENIVMVDEEVFQVVRMNIDPSPDGLSQLSIPGFITLTACEDDPWWIRIEEIASVVGCKDDTFNSSIRTKSGAKSYAKETPSDVAAKIKAAIESHSANAKPASACLEVEELRKELAAWKNAANYDPDNIQPMSHVQNPEELKARLNNLLDWVKRLSIRTEKAEAELAAERARPKGGVAWALRKKITGELNKRGDGDIVLHESRQVSEKYRLSHYFAYDDWEAVPYPLGADEPKAAIDAKEKAEAEVAAWKEAANAMTEGVMWIQSPCELAAHVKGLETKLAALKASLAEVPPLDSWRVLATAKAITYEMPIGDRSDVSLLCGIASDLIAKILHTAKKHFIEPYPLKD